MNNKRTTNEQQMNTNKNVKNEENDKEDTTIHSSGQAAKSVSEVPEKSKEYKIETPIQKLVCAYKYAKGHDPKDRDWDRLGWPRAAKSASRLLEYFHGSIEACLDCIFDLSEKFEKQGLSWTFETILKHTADYNLKKTEQLKPKNQEFNTKFMETTHA